MPSCYPCYMRPPNVDCNNKPQQLPAQQAAVQLEATLRSSGEDGYTCRHERAPRRKCAVAKIVEAAPSPLQWRHGCQGALRRHDRLNWMWGREAQLYLPVDLLSCISKVLETQGPGRDVFLTDSRSSAAHREGGVHAALIRGVVRAPRSSPVKLQRARDTVDVELTRQEKVL